MSFFLQNSATILQQIRAKIMQKVEQSAKILPNLSFLCLLKPIENGGCRYEKSAGLLDLRSCGPDETRTRDLLRDRQAF